MLLSPTHRIVRQVRITVIAVESRHPLRPRLRNRNRERVWWPSSWEILVTSIFNACLLVFTEYYNPIPFGVSTFIFLTTYCTVYTGTVLYALSTSVLYSILSTRIKHGYGQRIVSNLQLCESRGWAFWWVDTGNPRSPPVETNVLQCRLLYRSAATSNLI